MAFSKAEFIDNWSTVSLIICIMVLIINAGLSRPRIFNYFINLQIKAVSSFMASGGILLYMKWLTEEPIYGKSGRVFPFGLIDRCYTNISNSSLPTTYFKEVSAPFYPHSAPFLAFCLLVVFFLHGECLTHTLLSGIYRLTKRRGKIGDLIPLATTVILPDEKEKETRKAVVQLMLKKMKCIRINILSFMMVEFSYLSAALFGLIVNPVQYVLSRFIAIRLTSSEWRIDCGYEVTSQDVFALVWCQSVSNGNRIRGLCVAPNNGTLFHLHYLTWFCLLLLAVSTGLSMLYKIYGIRKYGLRKMSERNIVNILKWNVDYRINKETIDLFDLKLAEDGNDNSEESEISLLLVEDLKQGAAETNGDILVVKIVDVGISSPD